MTGPPDTRSSRRTVPAAAAALCVAAWAAGCGPAGPELHPAGGTVRFADGTPVAGAVVEYLPPSGGPAARGRTDADGRFTLATGGRAGAVAGNHRVGVSRAVTMDGFANHVRHAAAGRQIVPPHLASPATSGLRAVVAADAENDAALTVDPAAVPDLPPDR